MKTGLRIHLSSKAVGWLITGLGLLAGLCLVFVVWIQPVFADSGGFPTNTPRPTATFIVLPTQPPTPAATLIILPTQASSGVTLAEQKSIEETEASTAGGKSLAQVEPNQLEESAGSTGDSGMGSLFMIGLLIGLVILAVGALVYWLLRRTGIIT